MISATIIKDSTNWLGSRITTLILEYPRYIHGEFMTHRVLSKNAAGSRAIPVEKIIKSVQENTVYPIWTKNQKGMSGEPFTDESMIGLLDEYLKVMRDETIGYVETLSALEVHKQNANRYMEPFQHIKLICTGTEWDNFFLLRCHKDAQPEIQRLAEEIREAMRVSKPQYLKPGEWHIPFEDFVDGHNLDIAYKNINSGKLEKRNSNRASLKLKISVARCARISYNNFETNSIDVEKDIGLYDRLVVQEPLHASPAEHQARVPTEMELEHFTSRYLNHEVGKYTYEKGKYISNLNGWIQLRKVIENGEHFNN